jgi:hypothetical protein
MKENRHWVSANKSKGSITRVHTRSDCRTASPACTPRPAFSSAPASSNSREPSLQCAHVSLCEYVGVSAYERQLIT